MSRIRSFVFCRSFSSSCSFLEKTSSPRTANAARRRRWRCWLERSFAFLLQKENWWEYSWWWVARRMFGRKNREQKKKSFRMHTLAGAGLTLMRPDPVSEEFDCDSQHRVWYGSTERARTNMKCSSSSSMFLKASSDREKNIAKQMTNWRAKKAQPEKKKAQPPIRVAFRKMSMRWKMAGRKCFMHRRATSPSQTTNAVLVNLEKKIRHLNIVLQTFARALSGCCWLFV